MYYNKVVLIGFVGQQPEIHYYRPGVSRAAFDLATTERGYTKSDGTQVAERTEWHRVTTFGDTAQFVEKWVKKGSHLVVEGSLHYRSYTDREGRARQVTEIWADRVSFFESHRPAAREQ